MTKRFSRYKFALQANGGAAASGSPLDDYKRYRSGEKTVTYTRDPSSNTGGFAPVYLIPFGEPEDIYYLNGISERSLAQVSLAGGQTELKYVLPAAVPDGSATVDTNKYTPAAVTIFDPSGSPATEISKITGVSYKKRPGASYTFPFGIAASATAAESTFKNRAKAIKDAANTVNPENTVSFRPEILRAF